MKYKLLIIFSIILLHAPSVFAQEQASSTAKLQLPLKLVSPLPLDETHSPLIENALTSLAKAPESALSVAQKPFPKVLPLHQKVFKSAENIPVLVENAGDETILIELFNVDGEKTEITILQQKIAENVTFTLMPPAAFKPGKYSLKVTDASGNISEQAFFWGILAINMNKSIYLPQEQAKVQLSVLDETGKISCGAAVTLTIKDPQGQLKEYATTAGSIKGQADCEKGTNPTHSNFQTTYPIPNLEGSYELTLTAKIQNETYSITDNLQVKKDAPFIIERVGETQIKPLVRYTMLLNITAKEDFTGEISEIVPDEFEIGTMESFPPFQIATNAAETISKPDSSISFDLPFNGDYRRTQGFGVKETDPLMAWKYRRYGLLGHDGVDYSMPQGTQIFSIDDGIVVLAERFGDYGTTVVVYHRWGTSYYGHLSRITKRQGDIVKKGEQIGLSGDTGLSTGPHLHFGVKLKNHDNSNGFYGKVDPLPYITNGNPILGEVKGISTKRVISSEEVPEGTQLLTWDVKLKQGEKIQLGYTYLSSAEEEQIYRVEPLKFHNDVIESDNEAISETASSQDSRSDKVIFQEEHSWQISVDYTDQGTISVFPEKASTGADRQQYQFTYTTGESVDSGSGVFTIQVPQGWSAPQTNAWGRAGRTTIDENSTGIVGDLLHNMDTLSGWEATTACSRGLFINQTQFSQGKGSLTCSNGKEKYGSWYYSIPLSDWTNYTTFGMWVKISRPLKHGELQFAYDNSETLASPLQTIDIPEIRIADEWTWVTINLDPQISRAKVQSYGFRMSNTSSLENTTISTDYLLIGPGIPTIEGTGPWTITIPILHMPANDGKIAVNYGGDSSLDGVTNPVTDGVYTFLTKTKTSTSPNQNFVTLPNQPTVTLSTSPRDNPLNSIWIPPDERTPFSF